MALAFRFIEEAEPGDGWSKVFAHGWKGWRKWFVKNDGFSISTTSEVESALRRHLPKYEQTWHQLCALAGDDQVVARFLSFWMPPQYLRGCSQLALVNSSGVALIRNYDLKPSLNEATVYSTNWGGTRVIGMVDGLSGLSDGMNEHGLAVSLAFGGRPTLGRGFGAPILLRYALQTAQDTASAIDLLRSIPCHMSYNVTVVDRTGQAATVMLAPDRPALVRDASYAANHQLGVEWPRHGRFSNTVEREKTLAELSTIPGLAAEAACGAFLRAPLYSTGYADGFGTIYTTVYRPDRMEMLLAWPDGTFRLVKFGEPMPPPVTIQYSRFGAMAARTAHGAS